MLAGCGSAWKKPWTKTIFIHVSEMRDASVGGPRRDHASRSVWLSVSPSSQSSTSTRLVVYRQYTFGTVTVVVARERAAGGLDVAGLDPVVELLADGPRELVDERDGVDELEPLDALPGDVRDLFEQADVGLERCPPRRAAGP